MIDTLGDRMKAYYEDRYRMNLPRRSNVMIRIDGKAFHTYTKGLKKPYDEELMEDMNLTMQYLCEKIQGAKLGYVQSDEISIWVTDYDKLTSDAWFDYNIQKMCSIAASLATAKFNQIRLARQAQIGGDLVAGEILGEPLAMFDARVFILPTIDEIVNYFIWRQQDATRNSISMSAQAQFSHKYLESKSSNQLQEILFAEKGINWNDYPTRFKRGACAIKQDSEWVTQIEPGTYKPIGTPIMLKHFVQNEYSYAFRQFSRASWNIVEIPIFSQDKNFIKDIINIEKEIIEESMV